MKRLIIILAVLSLFLFGFVHSPNMKMTILQGGGSGADTVFEDTGGMVFKDTAGMTFN